MVYAGRSAGLDENDDDGATLWRRRQLGGGAFANGRLSLALVAWQDGYLLPPTRTGLGIEFEREAAKKHPFQLYALPQLRRLDGSVTNG